MLLFGFGHFLSGLRAFVNWWFISVDESSFKVIKSFETSTTLLYDDNVSSLFFTKAGFVCYDFKAPFYFKNYLAIDLISGLLAFFIIDSQAFITSSFRFFYLVPLVVLLFNFLIGVTVLIFFSLLIKLGLLFSSAF